MRSTRREFLAGAAALPLAAGCAGGSISGATVTSGMAATSQKLASEAAVALLREGGNAADAAVAAAAMLALTEPTSTGLGGDMFALYYDATTRTVSGLNGSGRAPAALSTDLLRRQGLLPLPPLHAHAVTVPGACAGWCDLAARHGSLPLRRVLAPAVSTARDGYPVGSWTSHGWAAGRGQLKGPGARDLLLPDGRAPRAGETFRNPALARVLSAIAEGGKDAYYKGEAGRAVVAAVRSEGGVMTAEDLAAHESTWVEPISTTYRGLRVWECPPNGQGITALLALNILEGFDLRAQDPMGPDRWHLLIEAMRLAFADARWYVADPASGRIPVAELLSKSYAAGRREFLDPRRAAVDVRRGSPAAGSDTVYFCVVDGAGNACSFINSNYMGFGTGIVPEGCGFPLQNRGACFVTEPGHPNCLGPRKRPYHTIIPGLLTREDGSLFGPFGVMGGFMQPQGHVQVVVGLADDRLEPQAVVDRPRFCVQPVDGSESRVYLEAGLPPSTVEGLRGRGHPLVAGVSGFDRALFGRGQVILRDAEGRLTGGSDPRADGGVQSL